MQKIDLLESLRSTVGQLTYIGGHMLEALLGSLNRERILLYLYAREEGYAREIARFFNSDITPIQKQLERLENGNVIYRKPMGNVVIFRLNPRYPFLKELKLLIAKVIDFYPADLKEKLLFSRKRPRRKRKPF